MYRRCAGILRVQLPSGVKIIILERPAGIHMSIDCVKLYL